MRNFTLTAALLMALGATSIAQVVAPASENFDAEAPHASLACNATPSGTYPAGWAVNVPGTDVNTWRIDTAGTTSGSTGPSGDNTTGSGNYVYTETSGSCSGAVATIDSPVYDISALSTPTIRLSYHMYGSGQGTFEVLESDGAGNYTVVFSISGDQGDQWNFLQIPATGYVGVGGLEAQFRIRATNGTTFTGDVAIDDVGMDNFLQQAWQTNNSGTVLNFDGQQSDGFTPAVGAITTLSGTTFNFSTESVGFPYDIAYNMSPIVARGAGGVPVPGAGQVVNLDVTGGLNFVTNGAAAPGASIGASSFGFSAPIAFNMPGTLSVQAYGVDPTSASGIDLSQAAQVDISIDGTLGASVGCVNTGVALTLTDDSFSQQALGFNFTFFGSTYSDVFVGSNGHVQFVAGNTGWASGATALTTNANPVIAPCSEDFNPSSGGVVTFFTDNVSTFEVCWAGVHSFGSTTPNDFSVLASPALITFDYANLQDQDGTVGLGAGSSINASMPVNFSLAGGVNGPINVPAGMDPTEDFTLNNDLNGFAINFVMDGTGAPIQIF